MHPTENYIRCSPLLYSLTSVGKFKTGAIKYFVDEKMLVDRIKVDSNNNTLLIFSNIINSTGCQVVQLTINIECELF